MIQLKDLVPSEHYNLTEEIEKHASDQLALKWQDADGVREEITYNQLLAKANKVANGLTELGLTKGDHVLVIAPRLIESYAIYLACLKAGIIVIPSSELLRAKDESVSNLIEFISGSEEHPLRNRTRHGTAA